MPPAVRSRSPKLFAAVAALLAISFLGTFHATSARARLPAVVQSQSDSAKPAQTQQSQPATTPDTTSKTTPAPGPNSSSTPSSPLVKADLKKAKQANKLGLRAEEQGDWEAAYEAYSDAVNFAHNDSDYFSRREIAKSHVVQMKVDLAERHAISGEIPAALHTLREAREEQGGPIGQTRSSGPGDVERLQRVERRQVQNVLRREVAGEPSAVGQRRP